MGDVVSITDTNDTELVQYEYDPWGKCIVAFPMQDDDSVTKLADLNPIRYRGYYYDNETGYYYLQSRYYDPDICRFINADVAQIINYSKDVLFGLNAYIYCCNNPINNSDPFGLFSKQQALGTISQIISGINNVVDYLLKKYKVSNKNYSKNTKYKSAEGIYKYVNQNKNKINKINNSISSIQTFFEILIVVVEVGTILSKKQSTARSVAEILFYGIIKVIAFAGEKLIEFIVTNIIQARLIVKYAVKAVLSYIVNKVIDYNNSWVQDLKKSYLSCITKCSISVKNYFLTVFTAAKKKYA